MAETKSPMARAFSCVRPAIFQTRVDGQDYWGTHAGCLVVTRLNGRIYCVIPMHCMKGFSPYDLVVTDDQMHSTVGVKAFFVLNWTGMSDAAAGMDVEDLAVICWPEAVPLEFEHVIDLDARQDGAIAIGDDLAIFGLMKSLLRLEDNAGSIPYNFYDLVDAGPSIQPLRRARGPVPDGPVETTGCSGGVVWNRSRNVMAGITLRGGIHDGIMNFHYMPFDIVRGLVVNAEINLRAKGLIDRPAWPARVDYNMVLSSGALLNGDVIHKE